MESLAHDVKVWSYLSFDFIFKPSSELALMFVAYHDSFHNFAKACYFHKLKVLNPRNPYLMY